MSFKKVKVVMLPTNEKANSLKGYLDKSLLFNFQREYKTLEAESGITEHFHLYFLSDDESKSGDPVFNTETMTVGYNLFAKEGSQEYIRICKKIIATTNKALSQPFGNVKIDLPNPSQQFVEKYIEEYNKGNIITEALVEYDKLSPMELMLEKENYVSTGTFTENILKVNPKDNTITIKKVKDNYTREEILELFKEFDYERTQIVIGNRDINHIIGLDWIKTKI